MEAIALRFLLLFSWRPSLLGWRMVEAIALRSLLLFSWTPFLVGSRPLLQQTVLISGQIRPIFNPPPYHLPIPRPPPFAKAPEESHWPRWCVTCEGRDAKLDSLPCPFGLFFLFDFPVPFLIFSSRGAHTWPQQRVGAHTLSQRPFASLASLATLSHRGAGHH